MSIQIKEKKAFDNLPASKLAEPSSYSSYCTATVVLNLGSAWALICIHVSHITDHSSSPVYKIMIALYSA